MGKCIFTNLKSSKARSAVSSSLDPLTNLLAVTVRRWLHRIMWRLVESFKKKEDVKGEKLRDTIDAVYDLNKIYWDADGNLRYGKTTRDRDYEVLTILKADESDADDPDETKLWMIVPSRWIKFWLLFSHHKIVHEPPGPINTRSLVIKDKTSGLLRPRNTLNPPTQSDPGHYRRVSLEVWLKLLNMYGCDGPAIAVLGAPYDEKSRWRLFGTPRLIDSSVLPAPVPRPQDKGGEKGEEAAGGEDRTTKKRSLFRLF
jgi:hypothetical protein